MFLRRLACAATMAAVPLAVSANPAITGTWSGVIDGQPLSVTFDGKGGGQVDGRPIRYQVNGNNLIVEDNGEVAFYQYLLRGGQLLVAGGQLPGTVTLSRGQAAPGAAAPQQQARGGSPADLVGKWCKMSSFTANGGGGSQSSTCFELRPDGTYTYSSERSASAYGGGGWAGTSGSSGDAGRWSATATSITAQSRSGQVSTYQLQRRNHPKNRDPMLCLDGECYVTYFRKNPW